MALDNKMMWLIGGGCGGLGCLTVVVAASLIMWAGYQSQQLSNPLLGESTLDVELVSEGGDGRADGVRIVERLDAADIAAELLEAGDGRMRLRIEDVHSLDRLAGFFRRGRLAFHMEAGDAVVPIEPNEELPPHVLQDWDALYIHGVPVQRPLWSGASREALEALRSRFPEGGPIIARLEERVGSYGETDWVLRLLDATPIVTSQHVAEAEAAIDELSASPVVHVTFDEEGARAFADATGRGVDQRMAIVLDGEVMSFPVIRQRISGGRAMITFGSHQDPGVSYANAMAVAASLSGGELGADWRLR